MRMLALKVKFKFQGQSQLFSKAKITLTFTFQLDLEGEPRQFHSRLTSYTIHSNIGDVLPVLVIFVT